MYGHKLFRIGYNRCNRSGDSVEATTSVNAMDDTLHNEMLKE